jgi:parallel beta-helix repeat protein
MQTSDQFTVAFNSSSNVLFQGFKVTGSANRGIWVVISGGGNEFRDVEVFGNQTGIMLYEGGVSVTQGSWVHDNTGAGVYVNTAAANVALQGVTVESNLGDGIVVGGTPTQVLNVISRSNAGFGIYLGSDDNVLSDLTVTGNGGTGIYVTGSGNIIAGSEISKNPAGIKVQSAPNGPSPTGNEFSDLDIHGSDPFDCIQLNDGTDTTFTRVHVHHSVGGIVESPQAKRTTIEDSEIDHIWGNDSHGLYLLGFESIIRRNRIHHVQAYGLHLWSAPWGSSTRHYVVEGNDVYANAVGVELGGSSVPVPDPLPDCETVVEGSPSWDYCRSFPRYVEIRYNVIHHNRTRGMFYDGQDCIQRDRDNSVHHNTFYANGAEQIYIRGGIRPPTGSTADPVTFKNNIIVGPNVPTPPFLVTVENSRLRPSNFDGNLYFTPGPFNADSLLFNWNGASYSLHTIQTTGVTQVDTCQNPDPPPTNVVMDARSAWSTNLRFVDPTMSRWSSDPAEAGRGDFHLRRGSDGISGGVCCPESNGGADIDGELVLFCLPQSCNANVSVVGIGADRIVDANADGVADRYDCTPANGTVCDTDLYTESQEATCVSQGYPGAPYDPNVYPGHPEICDGKDNDCDGSASFSGGEVDADLDGYFESCGMDCDATPDTGVPIHPGGAEMCNNIDDDCDNEVDEDAQIPGPAWLCGIGACQDHARCVNGNIECVPKPPGQETCNGIDDDCDGVVDNGVTMTSCGVGACVRSVVSCLNGVPQSEPCVPGAPGFEGSGQIATCFDGIDNDCDGDTDSDCSVKADVTSPTILGGEGTISGPVSAVGPNQDGNTYQVLTETPLSGKHKMTAVYRFTAPANLSLDFKVEGYKASTVAPPPAPGTIDNFLVRYAKPPNGVCPTNVSNSGWTSTPLTISATTDDGTTLSHSLGSASTTVWCIRLQDSNRSTDAQKDLLKVDRIYLFPHAP